ncbi:MAG TPA: hypothetical protein VFO19_07830 [Vicinamibacterales bacterium]|nr:hypothetical protein [Vicinamibacterales bacterium]
MRVAERTVRHVEAGTSVIDVLSGALDDFRTSYLLRHTAHGVAPGGWHDLRVDQSADSPTQSEHVAALTWLNLAPL